MPAPGALEVGRPVTLSTTGSNQLVIPRGCQLLGIWMPTAGTVALFDSATAAGAVAGNQIMPTTSLPIGWAFFPVDVILGLVANVSAAAVFVVC